MAQMINQMIRIRNKKNASKELLEALSFLSFNTAKTIEDTGLKAVIENNSISPEAVQEKGLEFVMDYVNDLLKKDANSSDQYNTLFSRGSVLSIDGLDDVYKGIDRFESAKKETFDHKIIAASQKIFIIHRRYKSIIHSPKFEALIKKHKFSNEIVKYSIFSIVKLYLEITKVVSIYAANLIANKDSKSAEIASMIYKQSEALEHRIQESYELTLKFTSNAYKFLDVMNSKDASTYKEEIAPILGSIALGIAIIGSAAGFISLMVYIVRMLAIIIIDFRELIGVSLNNTGSALLINSRMIDDEKVSESQKKIGNSFRQMATKFTNRYSTPESSKEEVNKKFLDHFSDTQHTKSNIEPHMKKLISNPEASGFM